MSVRCCARRARRSCTPRSSAWSGQASSPGGPDTIGHGAASGYLTYPSVTPCPQQAPSTPGSKPRQGSAPSSVGGRPHSAQGGSPGCAPTLRKRPLAQRQRPSWNFAIGCPRRCHVATGGRSGSEAIDRSLQPDRDRRVGLAPDRACACTGISRRSCRQSPHGARHADHGASRDDSDERGAVPTMLGRRRCGVTAVDGVGERRQDRRSRSSHTLRSTEHATPGGSWVIVRPRTSLSNRSADGSGRRCDAQQGLTSQFRRAQPRCLHDEASPGLPRSSTPGVDGCGS